MKRMKENGMGNKKEGIFNKNNYLVISTAKTFKIIISICIVLKSVEFPSGVT